jgi:hypothetical protein
LWVLLKNFISINLGNARLSEYETALKFLDAILHVQPGNFQAKNLKDEITQRMTREGCMFRYYIL